MTKGILEADSQPRIASLLPSATEIVAALGLEACLVGRSHECDFPESVARLPILTRSRVVLEGSSAEIDREVRKQAVGNPATNALGIYEVLADELQAVQPTHVVTQTQCEVCAVSLRDVEAALREITGVEAQLITLEASDLAGIWRDFVAVATALDDREAGERLAARCRARLDGLREARSDARPKVLQLEWLDPLMSAGHWTPELIEIAGGEPLLGSPGAKSVRLRWEDVATADPDIVVLAPCGFGLDKVREEAARLIERDEWQSLRAVGDGQVFFADGHRYFNRPGPRLVESAEILAEILGADGDFGHRGGGWTPAE